MIDSEQLDKINGTKIEELSRFRNWSSEIYSFGKILRQYGFFPRFLPLLISTDHGPSQSDEPNPSELRYAEFAHFYHSKRLTDKFTQVSPKRCYTMMSPFVWYRRRRRFKQVEKPKGTIVFPTHSTHFISVEQDWAEYIDKLKGLPSEFHPIGACLYFMDVQKGLHRIFEDNGIETFCAGSWVDPNFVDNFYKIIKNYKYASSPSPGSHLFYCVEFGLKFFIYGNEVKYINYSDENSPKGRYNLNNRIQLEKIKNKFSFNNIDKEVDKRLIYDELGIGSSSVSRLKFTLILYFALLNFVYRKIYWKLKSSPLASKKAF